MYKSQALIGLSRSSEALAVIDAGLSHAPDDPHLVLNRGAALNDLGRFEEAMIDCARAVELDGRSAKAHSNRRCVAPFRSTGGSPTRSQLAVGLDETLLNGHLHRATAAYYLGIRIDRTHLSNALASAESAIALSPKRANVRLFRATVLIELGELDAAADELDALVGQHELAAEVTYNEACILTLKGELEPAMRKLEECVPSLREGHILVDPRHLQPLGNDQATSARFGVLAADIAFLAP